MAYEIKMPQLGLTMTEGTIGRWLKNEGDVVNKGEALVEIETDKLVSEIESEFSGVLLQIIHQAGDEVPVQGIIAFIGNEGENVTASSSSTSEPAPQKVVEQEEVKPASVANASPVASSNGRIKVSPLAKKMAAEKNIDLSTVIGTGPGGRIVKQDILDYKGSAQTVASNTTSGSSVCEADVRREKMKPMRKTVAARMVKSHTEIPNVTQTVKVDVTDLLVFRATINTGREKEQKISINDFILKATAKALSQHKEILVSIDGDEVIHHSAVNLGMAVGIEEGLIVPVIKHADKSSLENISAMAKELAKKAKEGCLSADDYQGHTFTISNLGMYGIESFTPIINQPNAAILGVCAVQDELALDDANKLVKKQVMRLSLTYDHRLLDGAVVAKFQKTLSQLLENPMNILL